MGKNGTTAGSQSHHVLGRPGSTMVHPVLQEPRPLTTQIETSRRCEVHHGTSYRPWPIRHDTLASSSGADALGFKATAFVTLRLPFTDLVRRLNTDRDMPV
ncbi:hypothetical protein MN608_10425 [Microdochium nivale]|nr:hypothetical protein MN608_10425 [Microdochium nivale]